MTRPTRDAPPRPPTDLFSPASDASPTLPTPELVPGTELHSVVSHSISPPTSSPLSWRSPAQQHGKSDFLGHATPLLDAARILNIPPPQLEPSPYEPAGHHHARHDASPKRAQSVSRPHRPPPILVRRPTDLGRTVEPVTLSGSPTRISSGSGSGSQTALSPIDLPGGLNISLSPTSSRSTTHPRLFPAPATITPAQGEEADSLPELVPTPSPRRAAHRQSLPYTSLIPAEASTPLSPAWQSWQTTSPVVGPGSPAPGQFRQTSGERRESLGVPFSPLGPSRDRRTSLSHVHDHPGSPLAHGSPARSTHVRHGSTQASTDYSHRARRFEPTPQHGIHARNLSLFFPQPGQTPLYPQASPRSPHAQSSLASPRASFGHPQAQARDILIPPVSPHISHSRQPFGGSGGWSFGAQPGGFASPVATSAAGGVGDSVPRSKRRGHHHKHSLSHNFFSFLDPTVTNPALSVLTAGPSPVPSPSPGPASDIPPSVPLHLETSSADIRGALSPLPPPRSDPRRIMLNSYAVLESILGAALWVEGQIGGWRCLAGMGYLVVFDALGVAVKGVELRQKGAKRLQRPYGTPRLLALLHFTQALFLLFAAVYIAKESIEAVLLGSDAHGHGHSHAHPHADSPGLTASDESAVARGFPYLLLGLSALASLGAGAGLDNHAQLVDAVGGLFLSERAGRTGKLLGEWLDNPFTLTVAGGCFAVLFGGAMVPPAALHSLDSVFSLLLTLLTGALSFPTVKAFGLVLLQTAPAAQTAQMNAVRSALREVKEDRRVLGVGNVRVWAVDAGRVGRGAAGGNDRANAYTHSHTHTPRGSRESVGSLTDVDSPSPSPRGPTFTVPSTGPPAYSQDSRQGERDGSAPLVLTLTVHVAEEVGDREVLDLTRGVSEKLRGAIGAGRGGAMSGFGGSAGLGADSEVTVAVKRGWQGLDDM